jgi:3',5'-cyclic AMP phosphodiesterase CpdA
MMKRREFITNSFLGVATPQALISEVPPQLDSPKLALRIAHLTDTHLKPEKVAEEGFAKALHSVQELTPKPDFILNGGDAIYDALEKTKDEVKIQWATWKRLLKSDNTLPVASIIGNHDIFGWFNKTQDLTGDAQYGKAWVVDELRMPKRYYSFEKNNWKFIILDSAQLSPAGGYIAFIDNEQIAWLSSELRNTPATKHICIASHIPIFSACAGLFYGKTEQNGDLLTKRNIMHTDFFKLKNLFKHYSNIKLCISGHVHLQDEVKYLGITYYCNGAVCGNWWKGAFQDFAPAYAVIDFYDDGTFDRNFVIY